MRHDLIVLRSTRANHLRLWLPLHRILCEGIGKRLLPLNQIGVPRNWGATNG